MQGQELSVFSSVALRIGGDIAAVRASLDAGELVRAYPMRGTVFLGLASEMRWMTELLAKPGPERVAASAAKAGVSRTDLERIGQAVRERGPVDNAEFKRIVFQVAPDAAATAMYRARQYLLTTGDFAYVGSSQSIGTASDAPGLEEAFNGDRQAAVDTRGPVTEADVRWWSKLPAREVRAALAHLPIDVSPAPTVEPIRRPLLLPAFDEYILGYKDRTFAMTDAAHAPSRRGTWRVQENGGGRRRCSRHVVWRRRAVDGNGSGRRGGKRRSFWRAEVRAARHRAGVSVLSVLVAVFRHASVPAWWGGFSVCGG